MNKVILFEIITMELVPIVFESMWGGLSIRYSTQVVVRVRNTGYCAFLKVCNYVNSTPALHTVLVWTKFEMSYVNESKYSDQRWHKCRNE